MAEKEIVLVAAGGFWAVRDIIERQVFRDKFEMVNAPDFNVFDLAKSRVVAIVIADQKCGPELMDRFPNLKTIARTGTGYDNIDVASAKERDIIVTRVSALNAESVSDFALGLLFSLSRNIAQTNRDMTLSLWERKKGMLLSEMTVGVIGLGAIGSFLAKKLRVLGARRILGWNRTDRPKVRELSKEYGLELVGMTELVSESDAVIVAVALTPDTKNLLDYYALACMKKTALLINVARGAVVNEESLATFIANGWIGGTAIDVFSVEPPLGSPFEQPFVKKLIQSYHEGRNVILTPHNAWLTESTVEKVSLQVARNVKGVLEKNFDGVEVI